MQITALIHPVASVGADAFLPDAGGCARLHVPSLSTPIVAAASADMQQPYPYPAPTIPRLPSSTAAKSSTTSTSASQLHTSHLCRKRKKEKIQEAKVLQGCLRRKLQRLNERFGCGGAGRVNGSVVETQAPMGLDGEWKMQCVMNDERNLKHGGHAHSHAHAHVPVNLQTPTSISSTGNPDADFSHPHDHSHGYAHDHDHDRDHGFHDNGEELGNDHEAYMRDPAAFLESTLGSPPPEVHRPTPLSHAMRTWLATPDPTPSQYLPVPPPTSPTELRRIFENAQDVDRALRIASEERRREKCKEGELGRLRRQMEKLQSAYGEVLKSHANTNTAKAANAQNGVKGMEGYLGLPSPVSSTKDEPTHNAGSTTSIARVPHLPSTFTRNALTAAREQHQFITTYYTHTASHTTTTTTTNPIAAASTTTTTTATSNSASAERKDDRDTGHGCLMSDPAAIACHALW